MSQNGSTPPRAAQLVRSLIRHPVVHGHPLHAMLSDLPVTLMPAAFGLSLAAGARRKPRASEVAATWTARGALAAAAAAGGFGWWDWLTMPSDHPSRTTATWHGAVNTAALGLLAAASITSRRRRSALLGAATGGLIVSAWLGGDIVFSHGWRVRPAEEAEIVGATLQDRGLSEILVSARQEVSAFEQRETYIPPSA